MFRSVAPLTLVLVLAAGPALAEETTTAVPMQTPAPAAPPAKKSPADEVICKTSTPTGHLVGGSKTCMTRAQWANQAADASKGVTDFQNGSLRAGTPGH